MLVLVFLGGAAVLGALVLGVVGFGLAGQLRRLRGAVGAARADLVPRVGALRPAERPGRHRAD